MEENLNLLTHTPLNREIKQVQLRKKWGPLLPVEVRDITRPKPSDDVIQSIRDQNRVKVGKQQVAPQKRLQKTTDLTGKQ